MEVLTLKPLLNTNDLLAAASAGCWEPADKREGRVYALVIVAGDSFKCDSTLGILRRRVCRNISLLLSLIGC